MKLLILGVGSAVPTTKRNPSAQLLEVDNSYYLIDCGEGCQIRLRQNKIRMQRIKCIFITHLHGDHYLGLMGLLWTMNLLGRTTTLQLFAPSALFELIDLQNRIAGGKFNFELKFNAVDRMDSDVIYKDKKVEVAKFPLNHKIWCCGYRFNESVKKRKLIPEKIDAYNIPVALRKGIKEGKDFVLPSKNQVIPNSELTLEPPIPKSFAYCSDTRYDTTIVAHVKNVDTLYHEATFLNRDEGKAAKRMHSTAKQAAIIARMAEVRQLILGHYSNRYKEVAEFENEAKEEFKNVIAGEEDVWYFIS